MRGRFAGKITIAVVVSLLSLAFDASARPSKRLLLPDLQPIATTQVIGPETRPLPTFAVDAPFVIDGCFPDEIVRRGARRCLRFESIAANVGAGHLEVSYIVDQSARLASAYQRIYREDGSRVERFAIESEFHPTHGHFHIRDFYVVRLWKSTAKGGILGAKPVAAAGKNGFCPEDQRRMEGSQAPSNGYSCVGDWETSGSPSQRVGISSQWIDIYGANLPDQFVEITDVPDGYYALELELDPNGVFKEVSRANNVVCVVLKLKGTSARLVSSSCR